MKAEKDWTERDYERFRNEVQAERRELFSGRMVDMRTRLWREKKAKRKAERMV